MRRDKDWTLKHSTQQLALILALTITSPLLAQTEQTDVEQVLAPFGAYDPRGQDLLWSTANQYQEAGQHEQAIPLYRQAAHLSRVNEGLEAASQIPFIRAEIVSYRALNQLSVADDRQAYLARLENSLLPTGPSAVEALLRQAEWHQHMLLSNADDSDGAKIRMGRTWNLYVAALNKSLETYGEGSPELMPALEGMIRAHYLLADHRGLGAALPGEMRQKREEVANALRASYKRGVTLLKAIQHLNREVLQADLDTQADDYVRLGDWALWTGNRAAAFDYYDAALAVARGEQPHLQTLPTELDEAGENADAVATLVDEAETVSLPTEPPSRAPQPSAMMGQRLSLSSSSELEAPLPDEPIPSMQDDDAVVANDDSLASDSDPAMSDAPTMVTAATGNEPLFRILDDIVQLPRLPGFDPVLPVKTEGVTEDDLIISFNINEVGKAVNIERIQFPVVEAIRGPERVIRRLRATRFRPVFEDGRPVASETITVAFDKSLWARSTIQ